MNKFFVLAILCGVAMAVAKTDAECVAEMQKSADGVLCNECIVATSGACKDAINNFDGAPEKALTCAALTGCYQNVKDLAAADKKAAEDNIAAAKKAAEDEAAAAKKAAEDEAAAAKTAEEARMAKEYSKFCPTDTKQCTDKDMACATWAQGKECHTNPDWMLANCAKSCCPICKPTPAPTAKPTPKPTPKPVTCPTDAAKCTKNVRKSCHGWAGKKECTTNAKWMIPNCAQSCCDVCKTEKNGCPTVRDTCANSYATPDAKEGDRKCVAWAKAGECKSNSVWMLKNCSKSCCPICAAEPPAKATPAPVAPIPATNWGWNTRAASFGGYNTQPYGFGGYNGFNYGR